MAKRRKTAPKPLLRWGILRRNGDLSCLLLPTRDSARFHAATKNDRGKAVRVSITIVSK